MSAAAAASGSARAAGAARAPRIGGGEERLPLAAARGTTFVLLVAFGALHWMALLEPAAPARAWRVVGVAALAAAALLVAARLRGWPRHAAVAVAIVPLCALALLAGGLGDEWLKPAGWGELAAGISRGVQSLPGVRVPYEGIDPWVRLVIPLGGSLLALAAALLAFWPRRRGTGFPLAALILLVLLYAVPAVALDFHGEFLRGAMLALLVLGFLRLEKLEVSDVGAAGALALLVVALALIAAPALDRGSPWWDYESWALDTAASKSTAYSWDHTYGPLNWPRDGRELLRVRARFAAYWKAENLNAFDGLHWRRDDPTTIVDDVPRDPVNLSRWTQTLRVSVRNLRSDTFIAGGYAMSIPDTPVTAVPTNDGAYTAARILRRGDVYTVRIYTPQPTERQRQTAGTDYPPDLSRFLALEIPEGADPRLGLTRVIFPRWGALFGEIHTTPPSGASASDIAAMLARSYYRRAWALALRLKRGAPTPDAYVQRVLAYLGRGYSYSETPPPAARNLEGFLFDARQGYCQQFSGAMALLLRMGGVPARVATGFTAGSLDRKANEYVVRDFDAHSWVEAWYPGIGWVTFDPTPAAAPARSQADESAGAAGLAVGKPPSLSGDVPSRRSSRLRGQGTPWWQLALLGAAALAVAALAAWLVVRRRRALPLADVQVLERALRRARRAPAPGTTLRALEGWFAGAPAAAGYVRAVREQRYRGRPAHPTAAQRRALRAELARGAGPLGRLRAWWALPPGVR